MNDGHLQDSKGRRVSFKNAIIILTSNVGAAQISGDSKLGFDVSPDQVPDADDAAFEDMSDQIITELKDSMPPELINRIDDVIVFRGLNEQDCRPITKQLISQLQSRLSDQDIDLSVSSAVVSEVTKQGYSKEYGGRNLKRKVQDMLETPLADYLIDKDLVNRPKQKILQLKVSISAGEVKFSHKTSAKK